MRARWLVALLLAFACSDTVKKVPVTELLLRVHAASEVRAAMSQLRVSVSVQATSGGGWEQRPALTLDVPARDNFWPVDVPITPRDPGRLPDAFEVVIEALDDGGDALVQERAVSHFISESQRMLELTLARCGARALGSLCEDQADCHGSNCRRCDGSACSGTDATDPGSLPPIGETEPDNPEQPDAGNTTGSAGSTSASAGGGAGGGGGKPAAGSGGRDHAGTGGGGAGGVAGASGSATEIWSAPELLEASDVGVTATGAARNVAGDVVLVWRQDSSFGPYWARRYVGDKWDAQPFNFYGVIPDAGRFDVSFGIDQSGAAQVLYSDGSPHTYWLRWKGETTLAAAAPPLVLGDQQSYGFPTLLGVTESGNSVALWGGASDQTTQSRALYVNHFDAGAGWGTPLMFGNTGAQLRGYGAGVNASGDWVSLFRVGTGTGPNMVNSFAAHGGSISTPTAFDVPDALVSSSFLIGVDDSGNALTLYLSGADAQHLRFHWSRLAAGDASWASAIALTPEGTSNGAVTLAAMTVVLVSMEGGGSGGPVHLVAYRFDEGKGWSAGERITDDFMSDDYDLLVTANTSGAVIVTWSEATSVDGTSATALAYKRYTSGKGWGDKGTITSFAGPSSLAAVSLNADGRAIVAWSQAQPAGSGADLKWSRSP